MADNGCGGVHHGLQALGVGPNKQKKERAARLALPASACGLGSDPVCNVDPSSTEISYSSARSKHSMSNDAVSCHVTDRCSFC